MRYRVLILALAALLATPIPAPADQTNPRLDELFEKLQRPDPPGSVSAIEGQIWAIWFRHDDPQVRKLMNRGVVAMSEGRYHDALRLFTRVTKLAPEYAAGWNRRATTYYRLGRCREALADIEKVLQLAPRHFGALSGRGLCLERLGRPRAAIKAFEAALEVNPHLERVRRELMRLRARVGQYI